MCVGQVEVDQAELGALGEALVAVLQRRGSPAEPAQHPGVAAACRPDVEGVPRAQVDRLPYMYLPTDEWPLGSVVRQEAYLRIPPGTPPGEYALQMVVYEEEGGPGMEPLMAIDWSYADPAHPDPDELLRELNGKALADVRDAEGNVIRRALLRKESLEEQGRRPGLMTRVIAGIPERIGIHVGR